MTKPRSILLLAGSSEARDIAGALAAQGMDVRALKSEPPRGPNPMPVPYEIIDAPDADAIARAMKGADVVVDASHGFDAEMTVMGQAAAEKAGLPFATLRRPAWDVAEHPKWQRASNVKAAMALIWPGTRVFSATGWASLPGYADFPGASLMLRQTFRHDRPVPYDFVDLVFGDPPFSADDEVALFKELHVDMLICRNLGGRASRPKLDAAKALNLDVILIDRPPLPEDVTVFDKSEDILAWASAQ